MKSKYLSAFLMLYFGKLPSYFDFWAKSCEPNHNRFHWFVYTDQINRKHGYNKAVTLVPYTFSELCQDLTNKLNIHIPPGNTRIVCDCRVMLYALRKENESLEKYALIGYSDLDVIYGKIKDFMPEDPLQYSLISAEDDRPCGPFTLFNRLFLNEICTDKQLSDKLGIDHGNHFYKSRIYCEHASKFQPISGNRTKDKVADTINFIHLDESQLLMDVAKKYGPVFCRSHPLQPTSTRWFNHRKAAAFYENNRLFIIDNRGHRREGAFFHFSRLKNRQLFEISPHVLSADQWGIFKYGIVALNSTFTKIKIRLSLLY